MKNHFAIARILVCFMLLFVMPQSEAAENTPLDKFLDGLESFQADFKQTLSNEYGDVLETSGGIVYIENPGKFRWEYQNPYSQLIITDSKTLWIYDEDLEQVTIKDVSATIENTPASIISGQRKVSENYVINDLGDIDGFDWIELTPRDIESQYSSIRLGFNKDQLGMMILFDNLGQITRIDFLNPKRNQKFDNNLFSFNVPEGVDVIDETRIEQNSQP